MTTMKKIVMGALALSLTAAATVGVAGPASAAPSGNQLVCFDGKSEGFGNGVCKLIQKGAVLTNPAPGDYSGVYVKKDGLMGTALGAVKNLSFHYTRDVAGGAPRFSLAIDENGDGTYDFFAFADPNGCGSQAPQSGVVNLITKGVSNPNCTIYGKGGQPFQGYDAFVAAYPGAKYATDQLSFIISDQPGNYRVTQVRMNKPVARGA